MKSFRVGRRANRQVLFSFPLLMFMPSGGELLIIIFAVLLLFGGKKIPELMRGLGRGIREFNDARDNVKRSLDDGIRQAERDEQQRRLAAMKAEEAKPKEAQHDL